MIKTFPFIFIVLWSSAFITTKPLIDNSDPFSALAFRFSIVTLGFFLFSLYSKEKILISKRFFFESFFSGVLFHGLYLGGVFFSISKGMPTGIAALIVTLQPILTNALSGPILNEKVSRKQWVGVLLGFFGAALVLGYDIGSNIPLIGLVATIIALIAITSSTIWQKKLSNNLPLSVSNMYQALGGVAFHIIIIIFFVKPYINFTQTFIIAMSHQIFLSFFWCFYNFNVFNKKKFSKQNSLNIFFNTSHISFYGLAFFK